MPPDPSCSTDRTPGVTPTIRRWNRLPWKCAQDKTLEGRSQDLPCARAFSSSGRHTGYESLFTGSRRTGRGGGSGVGGGAVHRPTIVLVNLAQVIRRRSLQVRVGSDDDLNGRIVDTLILDVIRNGCLPVFGGDLRHVQVNHQGFAGGSAANHQVQFVPPEGIQKDSIEMMIV